jgi:hypothetical protein
VQLPGDDGQRLVRRLLRIRLLLGLQTKAERKKKNQRTNVFHGRAIAMQCSTGSGAKCRLQVDRLAEQGRLALHWQAISVWAPDFAER